MEEKKSGEAVGKEKKSGQTMEEMIARINALYHKSQDKGLTEEEKQEQAQLRKAYVENIRAGLRSQLDNISIVEKDGTITDLKDIPKGRTEHGQK